MNSVDMVYDQSNRSRRESPPARHEPPELEKRDISSPWPGQTEGWQSIDVMPADVRIHQAVCHLLNQRSISGTDIGVSVHDGVVTLTGNLVTPGESDQLADRVEEIYGVVEVNNRCRVMPSTDGGRDDHGRAPTRN